MRIRSLGALALATLVGTLLFAVSASGAAGDAATTTYLVELAAEPALAYAGGTPGLAATKPAPGKKLDRRSAAVERYVGHLKAQHDAVLAEVGGADKLYDFVYAANGVAVKLTEAQAAALTRLPGVVSVEQDELVSVDTSSTPAFLGLDGEDGLWSKLRGPRGYGAKGGAGEGIVIGVIDSGIWPENASFTDRKLQDGKLGKVTYGPLEFGPAPEGWSGTCQTGEQFTVAHCNNKLVGARYFTAGWGGDAALKTLRPWEFMSPRDFHGHGSHTSSTAGGNHGVPVTGAAAAFGKTSGIAPRARIATYKALYSLEDASTANGWQTDFTAAADQAIADGVDVINFSVGGTQTDFLNIVHSAFRRAATAGIFVATSAGNSGPGAGTVAHPSPWVTTTAATTHDRQGQGTVTIDGTSYAGSSAGTGSATGQLVTFGATATATTPATSDRLCLLGSLTPAAAGKIVFCERGVNARVEKSFEVQRVGGVGMVLVNPPAGGSLNADLHFVPSVHLQGNHYAAIQAAALAGKTASISGQVLYGQPAPFMAAFSSRGPILAGAGDLLKPDLAAPGVDVLAAVAPPGNRGRMFDLYSGTSMSSPHVAGLAALFKQLHPTWSPMAIKSALMTTGTDVLDAFTGTAASDAAALRVFAQGAGHVDPLRAADPGLVYDSGPKDWQAFLCGATASQPAATCNALAAEGYSFDRSDMNLASIAIGDLAGTQTVTRRVTNVDRKRSIYTASVSLEGIAAVVSPSTLTLEPGQTASFTIAFTRTSAPLDAYTAGHLTWSDGAHSVRSPIVVRPVPFSAPAEVSSAGEPVSWQVKTGYVGPLSATVGGLVAATQTPWTVVQDPDATFAPTDPAGTFSFDVAVPAGATLRAGIYEDAIAPTGTDLDLYVYRGSTLVGSSSDNDSNEEATVTNTSTAATYTVYVHGWSTNGPSASGTLFTWVVGSTPAGNVTLSGVGPATVGTQTHTAAFSGLAAGTRYLGRVDYSDGAALVGRTLLGVRTP
jgi:subtilisin family serine protease